MNTVRVTIESQNSQCNHPPQYGSVDVIPKVSGETFEIKDIVFNGVLAIISLIFLFALFLLIIRILGELIGWILP